MAKEETQDEGKKEVRVIELPASEVYKKDLVFETGKTYKVIVKPEEFVFSM